MYKNQIKTNTYNNTVYFVFIPRLVVPGCAGCAMAHPDFGRSVNPISTRGNRLCPPNYYWHTQIFRTSDGPDVTLLTLFPPYLFIWHPRVVIIVIIHLITLGIIRPIIHQDCSNRPPENLQTMLTMPFWSPI